MIRLSLTALGLTALAACEPVPPQPQPEPMVKCDDSFQSLVGSNIGAVTLPQGLTHRIASPGTALTEDYNADRLNIFVDDKGWIIKTECW